MSKMTSEIKTFVDALLTAGKVQDYSHLIRVIKQRYGVRLSKSTISKRARALKVSLRCGRKPLTKGKMAPAHAVFLDGAGAFLLKGAELETGLLELLNQMLKANATSARARKALKLAQRINATLLYAPIFGLNSPEEIVGYQGRGLSYLIEQNSLLSKAAVEGGLPGQEQIEQYLQFLSEHNVLPAIMKEISKLNTQALCLRIEWAGQTCYLDAQTHTVWPKPDIPESFSATVSKTRGYVENIFKFPSIKRPLILQVVPGYTFLPAEMFSLIGCLEQSAKIAIDHLSIIDKYGGTLAHWEGLKPARKGYFIACLSPWQFAQLQGTQIVRPFQQFQIGPNKEKMAVADAQVNLFHPQGNKKIKLRAALVRRKSERLALITNIFRRQERYIRRIAEAYFCRWPDEQVKNYYDLLEEAHARILTHPESSTALTPLLTANYSSSPQRVFGLFLEQLQRYAQTHFFPTNYTGSGLKALCASFYRQCGFLKTRQKSAEIILQDFAQKKLQQAAQITCQRFNQSGIKFPNQKDLRISLPSNE